MIRRATILCLLMVCAVHAPSAIAPVQDHVVTVARQYVGIRETNGNNRSPIIDKWNRSVGAPLGSPYCASAVSAWLNEAGATLPNIRSASSRLFIRSAGAYDVKYVRHGLRKIQRGDVIVWKRAGGGHIGIASDDWKGLHGRVVEANTSAPHVAGSQWNGDGVWEKQRMITSTSAFRITHVIATR